MRSLFVLLLGALFACVGCQSPSKKTPKSIVRINIAEEPHSLDPRRARDLTSGTVLKMLFEGLTRINAQNIPELALAESVDVSADGKTYTFRLRESAWSNGDSLNAFDFSYAWKKLLSPAFPSDTAFHLYIIKNGRAAKEGAVDLDEVGIHVVDARTLQVELEHPAPYFLELLTGPSFFPVPQKLDQEMPHWMQEVKHYVGNGPFQMTEWSHQDHITVCKNPHYWDKEVVKLDEIQLLMVQAETELNLFEKKEIDWAGSPISTLPVDALATLKLSSAVNVKEGLGTFFLRVNTEAPFLKNPKLRRALAFALDRQALSDHVMQGNQIPATGLVPLSLGLQSAPYFRDGDREGAQQLFQEVPEIASSISLLYRSSDRNHMIAQAIQQQWAESLGIQVELEAVASKVYLDRVSKQDYELALGSWIADFADPINFLEVFQLKTGGSNNTLWENAEYNALLTRSLQTADVKERLELLKSSEKILIDEMPIIPLFYFSMLYLNREGLNDVVVSPLGVIDFKWASKL